MMNTGRWEHSLAKIKQKCYVAGGLNRYINGEYSKRRYAERSECYDLETNTWTDLEIPGSSDGSFGRIMVALGTYLFITKGPEEILRVDTETMQMKEILFDKPISFLSAV